MNILSRIVTIACFLPCTALSQDLHALLESRDFGLGEGAALQETKREPDGSVFKIIRRYDYKSDRSLSWSTPQRWFVECALRSVAAERSIPVFGRKYRVLEQDGTLRPFMNAEETWDLGPDQFYVVADWIARDDYADADAAIRAGRLLTNDPRIVKFCADLAANQEVQR